MTELINQKWVLNKRPEGMPEDECWKLEEVPVPEIAEGNILINGIDPKIIKTEIDTLRAIGIKIKTTKNNIRVVGTNKIKNINIKTSPYPGFPTDLQAQLTVLLCKAINYSIIKQSQFKTKFITNK